MGTAEGTHREVAIGALRGLGERSRRTSKDEGVGVDGGRERGKEREGGGGCDGVCVLKATFPTRTRILHTITTVGRSRQ